ncbi:hypothetical protein TNCV_4665111 [Trichonephila clavipes]|nr:hypothetical protein TNCV_4665111 [Trichonephila clavipes]
MFAWIFLFETQQQGPEQAEKLLSAYVVKCLMPSSDPVQMCFFVMALADLSSDSTFCLELISQSEYHLR